MHVEPGPPQPLREGLQLPDQHDTRPCVTATGAGDLAFRAAGVDGEGHERLVVLGDGGGVVDDLQVTRDRRVRALFGEGGGEVPADLVGVVRDGSLDPPQPDDGAAFPGEAREDRAPPGEPAFLLHSVRQRERRAAHGEHRGVGPLAGVAHHPDARVPTVR